MNTFFSCTTRYRKPLTLIVTLATFFTSQAIASGFQINEHSATGLGRAFAGEGATNDNAAAPSNNAAALMLFDKSTLSVGATYLQPKLNVNGTAASGRNLAAKNIAPDKIIPNFHYIQPINERWAAGLTLDSNYGLSTKYNKQYPAGSLAGSTHLMTGNINANIAHRLSEQFSVGFGVNAVYAKAELTRHLGEMNHLIPLPSDTEVAHLKGDTWAYGWNAGALYELNDNNRFALSYRSKVDLKFSGRFRNDLPPQLGGTGQQYIPAKLNVSLPDIWEFGAYHRVNPSWALHYGATYTGWHTFKSLEAKNSNGQTLFNKEEGFRDSVRLAVGTTYYYQPDWTFRAGIAYDQSAAPANKRSISIPDQDRYWLSTGSTYQFTKNTSVDFGLAYMQGKKVTFTEHDKLQQNYHFSSKGHAMLYAVNVNYQF